jgi:hypothetical protein
VEYTKAANVQFIVDELTPRPIRLTDVIRMPGGHATVEEVINSVELNAREWISEFLRQKPMPIEMLGVFPIEARPESFVLTQSDNAYEQQVRAIHFEVPWSIKLMPAAINGARYGEQQVAHGEASRDGTSASIALASTDRQTVNSYVELSLPLDASHVRVKMIETPK